MSGVCFAFGWQVIEEESTKERSSWSLDVGVEGVEGVLLLVDMYAMKQKRRKVARPILMAKLRLLVVSPAKGILLSISLLNLECVFQGGVIWGVRV